MWGKNNQVIRADDWVTNLQSRWLQNKQTEEKVKFKNEFRKHEALNSNRRPSQYRKGSAAKATNLRTNIRFFFWKTIIIYTRLIRVWCARHHMNIINIDIFRYTKKLFWKRRKKWLKHGAPAGRTEHQEEEKWMNDTLNHLSVAVSLAS